MPTGDQSDTRTAASSARSLAPEELEQLLQVTRKLAAPFDLHTMLEEVVEAGKRVLAADSGSVWLYDAHSDELVLEVATGIEPVRVPADAGIVGECARSLQAINVEDCYADPRFNPEVDRRSGYHTRCMLTLPLVGHDDALVGVMQMLNKLDGVFGPQDELLASALAAQCAVALQRVRMTAALIEGERLRREVEVAREVQMSTLPETMPEVAGYDLYGSFHPADLTGGDTFDLVMLDQGLFILLGDATGHGVAPALSATQMQSMLRAAFRCGADLETAYRHVNDQLAEDLAEDRFVTAFMAFLDPDTHHLEWHSGGQGPILHYRAHDAQVDWHQPTLFPMGAMTLPASRPARALAMDPGDLLVLLSDGIYEYHGPEGDQFGEDRVAEVVRRHHQGSSAELAGALLEAVERYADGAPQQDDVSVVIVKRLP